MGNVYMEAEQIRYKSASYRNVQEGLDAAFAGSPEGLDQRVAALETTVGDNTAGLVKDVDDLETTVGDSTAGLVKDVTDLQTTVGDSSDGLVKDVTDLQTTVGGAIQWDDAKTSVKKNYAPPFTTTTSSDVTFTVASDGTVSLSGTASSVAFCELSNLDMTFDEPMLLTGCPSGGAAGTYRLDINNGANDYFDIGDGFTLPANVTINNIRIRIGSGVNTSGMIFKPMLRPASIEDNTYVPFIYDNVELAEALKYEESAFTNVPEGATVTINKLIKFGKVVMACATISGLTVSEWTTFLNIPDGFRPATNFKILDTGASRYYTAFSGGYVQSSAALSANAIEIFATWITD